ncbi:T9SS type A sorting domain-containing protein, partial [Flavobacterium sp.]|uniref:T9SS type A sorting domain-containing protein n=1 Tax=Flavobacterium sp. TaxID=239 RepID=UPI0038FCD60B
TATNSTGFNWSISNGAAGSIGASTGIMTWANGFSGSVNIQVTANGCNGPTSPVVIRTVIVNPLPTVFNVTGTGAYCSVGSGLEVGLDGSSVGVNYQLYNGVTPVGSAIAGTGSAISFGTQAGTITYTVKATNTTTLCTNTMAGSAVITVSTQPTASAGGSQTICQNGSATVSGATSSNGTIVWTENGSGSITGATTLTPVYTSAAVDGGNTVALTMTVSNSPCIAATATYLIVVTPNNTVSAASSSPTLCSNTLLTAITHTTTGATGIGVATGLPTGVAASWASGIITISGTPSVAGTFNYSIPLTGGCGAVSATGTITILPKMTVTAASNSVVCQGTTLNLSATVISGAVGAPTYYWTGPLGFNSTSQNPSITNVSSGAAGVYTLTATNGNGCITSQTTTGVINSVPNVSIDPAFTTGFVKKSTGEAILYTYTIKNIGSVSDIFDLSAAWVNDNADNVNMDIRFKDGATFYPTPYYSPLIPPGGTFTFQVELQVQGGPTRVLNHTKVTATSRLCTISSTSADMYTYEYNSNTPPASSGAQLELSKTASTTSAIVGVPFNYVITIVNNSSSTAATGVIISDQVPANLMITNNGGGDQLGQSITWSIGDLTKIGAGVNTVQKTITVVPTCASVPSVTNTANVLSTPPDNNQGIKVSSITIPVIDNIPPTAICKSATVPLDATGNASITASDINNGSSDTCGIQSITISKSTFNCSNIGPNTVSLTVADVSGNTSTCDSVVTIVDNLAPVLSCPITPAPLCTNNSTKYTKAGTGWNATATDNCSVPTLTYALTGSTTGTGTNLNGVDFNIGTTKVTWTAVDARGNTSNCAFDVIVNALPTTSNAGADQSNCNTETFTLAGNTATTGIGTWTKVSGAATITITSPTSPTSGVTGITAGTSATLRWTISNGACSSTDDVILNNNALPTTSIAGVDQTNCNNSAFTLAGNTPTVGTGAWSLVSGTATITTPNSNTSVVTGVTAGTSATLRWTISNGTCTSTDDVILTNNALPTTSIAGADQSNCNTTTFTLVGNAATVGTGTWTLVSGVATITTPSSNTSGVSGITAGTSATLRWTISNGTCTTSTDDVILSNNALPTAGLTSNDADNTFCAGTSVTFTATTGGTNYNFRVGGATVQNGATATYTTSSLTNGQVVTVDVNNASSCSTTSSGIINTVNGLPIITTQPINQLDCEGASVNFKVIASGTALTYVWQYKKSGDSSFTNIISNLTNVDNYDTNIITIRNVGSAQFPNGTQFQVIVTNSSGCSVTSTAATLTVNGIIDILPKETTVTQCYGTNYSYTVSTSYPTNVVSYQWKSSIASGSWNPVVDGAHFSVANNTPTLTIINGTPAESAEYRVYIKFTSSSGDCIVDSASRTRMITFLPLLTPPISAVTQPTCTTATGTITVTVQSASDTYSFDNGITYQASNVKSGLATGNYNIIIKNTQNCISPTTTAIIDPQPITPIQPTLSLGALPTCNTLGNFTITNYNASTYAVTPITGVVVSGNTITAPTGNYTVIATLGSCSSIASASINVPSLVTNTWTTGGWSTGLPDLNTLVIINGDYTIDKDNPVLNACSLTINAGKLEVQAGTSVIIQNDLTVNTGATLDVLDKGSLVMVKDSGIVTNTTGTTKIRRFTTVFKQYDYVYWSTPIISTSITNTFQSIGWKTNRAYEYIPGSDWSFASNMSPGKGYIIMTPTPTSTFDVSEVVFTGKVNNGIQKITGVIPNSSYLLGNPYPSAIDADKFLDANAGVLDGTLYFWTHNTAIQLASGIDPGKAGSGAYAFTSDDYATYNRTGGVGTGTQANNSGLNTSIPTGKIASCQGFFGSSNTTIIGTNEIVYNNSMRLSGTIDSGKGVNEQFFKTSNTKSKTASVLEKHRIWLDLNNSQGAFKQTLVGYITGATNDYDSRFDGESFDGNQFVDFYSVNQNKNLTIQGRTLPFDENDTVALGFKTTIDGSFTINIGQVDGLLIDQAIYLEDKLTNTIFDLKTGNYTFTTAKGTFNNRFVLRYTNDKSLGIGDMDKDDGILVFYSNNYKTVIIKNNVDSIVNSVSLFNMTGQKIDKWDFKDGGQTNIQIPVKNIPSGIYIVKVKTSRGESSKKIIVRY